MKQPGTTRPEQKVSVECGLYHLAYTKTHWMALQMSTGRGASLKRSVSDMSQIQAVRNQHSIVMMGLYRYDRIVNNDIARN